MSPNGKVALLAGAGYGIGRGLATALAESGAQVACVACSKDELPGTERVIRQSA